jgi:DNA repair protein RecO (recombination protein O)
MKAIILKKRDRGEADELVVFLSRDLGWLTGVAKNAKKSRIRFGGHLEPLSVVDLVLRLRRNDNLVWIDQSQVVCGFLNIRTDLAKVSWAAYFLELASVFLPEGHPDPALFDCLTEILTTLDSSCPNPTQLLLEEIRLLGYLGYAPRFDICPLCGEQLALSSDSIFSPTNGAACHAGCVPTSDTRALVISPSSLAMIRRGMALEHEAANRLRLNKRGQHELRSSLSAFVRYLRGADINSLAFLEKIHYR